MAGVFSVQGMLTNNHWAMGLPFRVLLLSTAVYVNKTPPQLRNKRNGIALRRK